MLDVGMGGQDQDAGFGEFLADLSGRVQPLDRMGRRHPDVDHHQLGRGFPDHRQYLPAVTGLPDDREARALEQARQPLPEQDVVVRQDHPGPGHGRAVTARLRSRTPELRRSSWLHYRRARGHEHSAEADGVPRQRGIPLPALAAAWTPVRRQSGGRAPLPAGGRSAAPTSATRRWVLAVMPRTSARSEAVRSWNTRTRNGTMTVARPRS